MQIVGDKELRPVLCKWRCPSPSLTHAAQGDASTQPARACAAARHVGRGRGHALGVESQGLDLF